MNFKTWLENSIIENINEEIPKDFIIAFHNIINNLDGLGWEEIEKFKIEQSMIWIKSLLEQTKVNNVEAELNWWKEQLEIIEPPFEDKEEVDLLKGEWIYDHGKLTEADVKTHEETIEATIFLNHRKELVSIAEKLIKQIESKKPEELDEELEEKLDYLKKYKNKIKNLPDYIEDDNIGESEITNIGNLYDAIKNINPQLFSNQKLIEGMQVLSTHGDVRKYGCKSLGFIIIRGPFFEVWELNQDTANEIVDAAEKIMEEKREDRSREDEQTIGIHSYKTNKGSEYTIEQLRDKKLNVTPTISQGKSNHFIPQASTPEGLSTTQRHQLLYTSENFSFKTWLENSIIENPDFKNWFKNSKVIDSEGNPIVVYHQTSKEAAEKIKKFGFDSKKSAMGGIIWVTSDKSAADKNETGAGVSGAVFELYASIQNPAGWDEYDKKGLDELLRDGYDGVILKDKDGTFNAIVFDPKQLKSIKNKGTFSTDTKKIHK
jgi:hypothetical protein